MQTATANAFSVTIGSKRFDLESPITKANARALDREIVSCAQRKRKLDLEFCKWMYHSKYTMTKSNGQSMHLWEVYDFDTWEEYVEQRVGITAPRAQQFVNVYSKYCVELGNVFDPKSVIDIRKMVSMAHLVDEDNVNKMLARAATMSHAELKALTIGQFMKDRRYITYSFNKGQDRTRMRVMRKAREEFGKDLSDGELTLRIMKEWYEGKK
jgi:hypothetical protein